MLPDGWKTGKVSDVCRFENGHGFGPEDWAEDGLPIIRIQNLNDGKKFDYFSGVPDEKWIVRPGQMLFAWAGTRGVSFGPTIWKGQVGVLNQHIFKVTPKEGFDHEWVYRMLLLVTDRIERKAHGFKATLVHVKKSDIENNSVYIPPLVQQKKIAKIINVWGDAIISAQQMLLNSQNLKKALIGRLLRRKEKKKSAAKWSFFDLDAIFERVVRKNEEGNDNVLTISGEHGLISQRDYFNKSVASDNLSGYTLIRKGEFAYNKSYSNGYPMGAIKPLQRYEAGVVSSLYICFRIRDDVEADLDFFRHYFEAGLLNEALMGVAQEGARNHGLLNVGVGDFFKLRLQIPAIKEQRRIAAILNAADTEIDVIAKQLAALRTEKQALMQQLLTGKRRVTLPTAAKPPLAKAKLGKSTQSPAVKDRRK